MLVDIYRDEMYPVYGLFELSFGGDDSHKSIDIDPTLWEEYQKVEEEYTRMQDRLEELYNQARREDLMRRAEEAKEEHIPF